MREYVEKMISDYPKMLRRKALLQIMIEEYVPVTAEDMITSMTFCHPEGDRVQTSNISDKTATIAIEYLHRLNEMNENTIGKWTKERDYLDAELGFLEGCIHDLPKKLYGVMSMLVLDGSTWDEVGRDLCVSRTLISKYRNEALSLMTIAYQKRASAVEALMLA